MSTPRDVCPEADHPEVEISKVRAKIVTVEAEILEVKAEIMKVKADPSSQLRPGLEKEKQILREELVELRKKENILLGTKLSGTSPVAKTVEVAIPALLHYGSTSHAYVTFDGDESFKVKTVDAKVQRAASPWFVLNVACICIVIKKQLLMCRQVVGHSVINALKQ